MKQKQKPKLLPTHVCQGPVIIYDPGGGGGRKTAFSRKNFRGPLSAWTKNFAAHSTLWNNFSTPTLYNRSIFIGKKCANHTCLKILYSLDSKPGGLLSKRGSRQGTSPLEIHYTQGLTVEGGLLLAGGLLSRLCSN